MVAEEEMFSELYKMTVESLAFHVASSAIAPNLKKKKNGMHELWRAIQSIRRCL